MGKLIADGGVLAGALVITIPPCDPGPAGEDEGGIEITGEEKPGTPVPPCFSPTPAA